MRITLRSISILFWSVFFIVLFSRMISYSPHLQVGHENVWSDWALHIGLATIFETKPMSEWFAYHPIYADGKLTYAFLTNLISGLLMRAGMSLPLAFILPSIALSVLLLIGMHRFLTHLLKSEKKAILAVVLFFFSAGLGFIDWLNEIYLDPAKLGSLDFLLNPPQQYSKLPDYQWGTSNWIVGHLLPQRAFLLGMPLALWSMLLVFECLSSPVVNSRPNRTKLIIAGLLAGLLPIAHMHSFIATVLLIGPTCAVHYRRWKTLLYYVLPAGVVSTFLYFKFVHAGIEDPNFMQIHLWYTSKGFVDWLKFWVLAWGPMLPLAIFGTIIFYYRPKSELLAQVNRKLNQSEYVFFAMAFVLFALGNVIYFQPISWDNTKLFLWVYFIFSALAAESLAWLWNRKALPSFGRVLAVILFVGMTWTGTLELIKLQRVDTHTFTLLNTDELEMADRIRAGTGYRERFLTAPEHNHPVTVRGARPILLGYTGWVWNFGFLYHELERDVEKMFKGTPQTLELLKKHQVSYVYIGPAEMHRYQANEAFFASQFPLAYSTALARVYDVRVLRK